MTNSRAKGVKGEREFLELWQRAGFSVRGLEAGGDHFIVSKNGHTLHGETKRQERWRLPEWIKQVRRDTPPGLSWVLGVRRNREPWVIVQDAEMVVRREARLAELEALIEAAEKRPRTLRVVE